jgi:hypothetical protein
MRNPSNTSGWLNHHVSRTAEQTNAHISLLGQYEAERTRGMCVNMSEDNTEIYFIQTGRKYMHWILFALLRIRRWVLQTR